MRRSGIAAAVLLSLMCGVLLTGCGGDRAGRPAVRVAGVRAPALRIVSPPSRARLTLPVAVHYQLDGLSGGATLRVFYGSTPVDEYRRYLLDSADGRITLPDDKALQGMRTLTFCLADGERLLPGTCQTLHDLLLTGGS